MTNAMDMLREAHAKVEAKAKRLRAQIQAAEVELSEIETAIRVMERISGEKAWTPELVATDEDADEEDEEPEPPEYDTVVLGNEMAWGASQSSRPVAFAGEPDGEPF